MAQVIDMEHKEEAASERSKFGRACVFGGSCSGTKESYKAAAIELGQELVARKVNLVYGGGLLGLMGSVAQAVHDGGGHVLGIIPRRDMGAETAGETVGEDSCYQITCMHQRKAAMARYADCFIALPGGFSTMEELLEKVSWSQLGIHDKPVGVLDVDGFYNYLLRSFDEGVENGFILPSQRHIMVVAANAKELLNKLEEYVPVHESPLTKESWMFGQQQEQSEIQLVGFNGAPAPHHVTTSLQEREEEEDGIRYGMKLQV